MERPSRVFMSSPTRVPNIDEPAIDCVSPIKPIEPSMRRLEIGPALLISAADALEERRAKSESVAIVTCLLPRNRKIAKSRLKRLIDRPYRETSTQTPIINQRVVKCCVATFLLLIHNVKTVDVA